MPCTEVVGVLRWINHNLKDAVKKKCEPLDTTTAETVQASLTKFLDASGLSHQDVKDLGHEAKRIGVSPNTSERVFEIATSKSGRIKMVNLFRPVWPSWNKIDGTIVRTEEDDARRYNTGPRWRNNSCAEDSILVAALQLDVGRIQMDQIRPAAYGKLTKCARTLRLIVAQPWGTMTSKETSAYRDRLSQIIGEETRFSAGHYKSALNLVEILFKDLPQVSFTWVTSHRCCDGIRTIRREADIRRDVGIYLQLHKDESFQQSVYRWLQPADPKPSNHQCSNGEACQKILQNQRLILDRLPPVLCLLYEQAGTADRLVHKYFDDLSLSYSDTNRDYTGLVYEPVGAIFYLDANSHYVLRWRVIDPTSGTYVIVHYDGMISSRLRKVDEWLVDIDGEDKIVVVFFQRKEVEVSRRLE